MKDIIESLADNLMHSIPEFKRGIAIARLDEEGRVLLQEKTSNEFSYAGLNDYDDNYFYIRHRETGVINYGESSAKKFTGAQNFFRVEYQMRIVACMKNACPYNFEEKIRFVLMNSSLPSSAAFANVSLVPIESQIDSIQVLKDESKKAKTFDKNLIFISHDFNIVGDRDFALEFYCENPCYNAFC
jgi:hypothetical protein